MKKGDGFVMDMEAMLGNMSQMLQSKMPECLAEFAAQRQSAYDEKKMRCEKRGEELEPANWHADGYVLFRILVKMHGNLLRFKAKSFDWMLNRRSSGPKGAEFIAELPQEFDAGMLDAGQKERLFQQVAGCIKPFVLEDGQDAFAPLVEVAISFEPFDKNGISQNGLAAFSQIVERENTGVWRQKLHAYAQAMQDGQETPSGNLENVLWAVWKYEYKEDGIAMLRFIDAFYKGIWENGKFMARECREQTSWFLTTLCRWVMARGGPLSADEQALFAYTGALRIERAESQDDVKFGKKLKQMAEEAAGAPAGAAGKSHEEDVFRTYADENVVLKAVYNEEGRSERFNEGLESRGRVQCEILRESEAAYKTALGFLQGIAQDGFSPRCDFALVSSAENYIELADFSGNPDDFHCGHNQFWANCLQYPALREDMRRYVQLAAKKVEKVSFDEMEDDDAYARRADFYAAAALTLSDPTGRDFAESFAAYLSTVHLDDGQRVVHYLANTYLEKYGVGDENAANLVRAIEKSPEMLDTLMEQYLDFGPKERARAAVEKLAEYSKKAGLEIEALAERLEG